MKTAQLTNKCREIAAGLANAIKKARDDNRLLNYLSFCARFHSYSFANRLLIWAHRPNATFVAGVKTWQKMGRHVKKGEKGIPIFAPITVKKPRKVDLQDQGLGSGQDNKDQEIVTLFKVVYVFDVTQTEGKPIPQAPDIISVNGDASSLLPALEALVTELGITLKYVDDLAPYGVSKGGGIEIRASLNTAERFAVLVHELAHELLHRKWQRTALSTKLKELEAEATAYVVLTHFGLECNAPTYLALYRVEQVDILESLERIAQTASTLIGQITALLNNSAQETTIRSENRATA